MKKIISLVLALCMCLGVCAMLGSCGGGHTHTFATTYSHDATNHWYACTGEACTEVSGKAAHTFVNNACSACGYKTTPPEPATEEVSESVFGAALSFEGVTNVMIGLLQKNEDGEMEATYHVDGAKNKVIAEGETTYYHVDGNELWCYLYDEDMGWSKMALGEPSGMTAMMAYPITTFSAMLSGISFTNLTYTDGYYVGEALIYGEENVTVKLGFKSSRLVYARLAMDGNENDTVTLEFSAYGTTAVTLPTILIDPDEWRGYFEIDNFTATMVQKFDYEEYDLHTVTNEVLKRGDGKWLFTSDNYSYNDTLYLNFAVYFDGTNAYVNGVIDNEEDNCAEMFSVNFTWFEYYLASFTETAPGVFEAALINTDYGTLYKDVRIVVQDGKLASVSYKTENTQYRYHEEYTFTFSSIGTTVVDGTGYAEPPVWNTYFNLDNVTVKQTFMVEYEDQTVQGATDTTWKIDGDRWVLVEETVGENDKVVYFDGTNGYYNGQAMDVRDYSFEQRGGAPFKQFISYETSFSKTTTGDSTIYYADEIVFYGVLKYTDIEIVVENGRVVSQTLTYNGVYAYTYTYTFTDYGTTVVGNPFA